MKCFCGREFNERRGLVAHIRRNHAGHFTDLELERYVCDEIYGKEVVDAAINSYILEEVCADDLNKSIKIVTLLQLMGIKRTNREEKKTKRYKEKYIKTMKERYGEGVTNPSQLEFVQKKKEDTISKKYGVSYEAYLQAQRVHMKRGFDEYVSDDARVAATVDKIETTCLERYGQRNFGCGSKAKEKSRKTRKEIIAQWDYEERLARTSKARAAVNHRGGFSSKPEKRIRRCLVELDIDFQTNVHMWNYNYDMKFGKFIIEVQGDMWHANPQKYKANDLIMGKILASDLWEKDEKKKKKAEDNGYTVIPIWECDIKGKSDTELLEMVKLRLEENGYDYN